MKEKAKKEGEERGGGEAGEKRKSKGAKGEERTRR